MNTIDLEGTSLTLRHEPMLNLLRQPNRAHLYLFDRHLRAVNALKDCMDDVAPVVQRLGIVARYTSMEIATPVGGRLMFGVADSHANLLRYKGIHFASIDVSGIPDVARRAEVSDYLRNQLRP